MFNIYVTGYTEGIVDGGTLKGSRDVLVAKYNTSAVLQWARQLGDSYSEGKAIVTDDSFNVYVVGFTNDDLVQKLQEGEPSIWTRVSLDAPRLEIHVFGMGPGEPELVGNAIAAAARGD